MKRKSFTSKLFSMILAVALVFGMMPLQAFATDQVGAYDSTKSAKLTIEKTDSNGEGLDGAGYTLYKVADFKQTGGNAYFELATGVTLVTGKNISDSDLTAADFIINETTATKFGETVTANGGIAEFTVGTEHGLYVAVETTTPTGVVSANNFLVALPTTTPDGTAWEYDVTATPKNSVNDATLGKTVAATGGIEIGTDNNGDQTVHVGQELEYTIESSLPTDFFQNNASGNLIYYPKYDIIDTPGAGLQIDATTFKVEVAQASAPTVFTDITSAVTLPTTSPYKFSMVKADGSAASGYVPVHTDLTAGAIVKITYKAKVVGLTNITNKVQIDYTDKEGNPGTVDPDPTDPEPVLKSYSHAAIKVNKDDTGLNGAEFVLKLSNGKYLAAKSTNPADGWTEVTDKADAYKFVSGTMNPLATFTDDGMLYIMGVKGGNHQLEEVKAPTGYQLLTAPVNVTFDDATTTVADAANGTYTTKIVNAAQFALPGTGGAGIYFYVAGGLVLIGAAVILLAKSKKSSEETK